MGFFGDENDPFEDIMKEFFGPSGSRKKEYSKRESEENGDIIESKDKFFVIFELPGYSGEDISVEVKGNKISVIAKKESPDDMEDYLIEKLSGEINMSKTLPSFIKTKSHDYTFRNGVLEVSFPK